MVVIELCYAAAAYCAWYDEGATPFVVARGYPVLLAVVYAAAAAAFDAGVKAHEGVGLPHFCVPEGV